MIMVKASIITIGDELLIGQTIDTNSAWIAVRLNAIGIEVLRRVAVGDEKTAIITALDEEAAKADLIIMTGGLGPTSDDITKPLLCAYFDGKLVLHQDTVEHIKNLFSKMNRPVTERNLRQAELPDTCSPLFNRLGTAPGMWFEKNGKIFIALPGVPQEMAAIMEDAALPKLDALFKATPVLHCTTITAGEGESFIADKLVDFEALLPQHIKLAYLPDASFVKLRLSATGREKNALQHDLQIFQERLVAVLGKILVALDDIPVEKILAESLKEKNKTVGTAESCTGGLIGHLITQVAGASNYYLGSVVSYSNEVKENVLGVNAATIAKHGVVSEAVAVEMVKGALTVLKTDFAVATTGLVGTEDAEGVKHGTVWIAAGTNERTVAQSFYFRYNREKNKELAARNAILMLWKLVTGRV
jgi:nicotinamide-nucleotide amidase